MPIDSAVFDDLESLSRSFTYCKPFSNTILRALCVAVDKISTNSVSRSPSAIAEPRVILPGPPHSMEQFTPALRHNSHLLKTFKQKFSVKNKNSS